MCKTMSNGFFLLVLVAVICAGLLGGYFRPADSDSKVNAEARYMATGKH